MDGGHAWMLANMTLRRKKEKRNARHPVGQPPRCAFFEEKASLKDSLIPHKLDDVLQARLQILHTPHLQPICKLAMFLGYKSNQMTVKSESTPKPGASAMRPQSAQQMSRSVNIDFYVENVSRNRKITKHNVLEHAYSNRPKSATPKSRKLGSSPETPSKSPPWTASSSNLADDTSLLQFKRLKVNKSSSFLDLLSRKKSQSAYVMTARKILEAEIKQAASICETIHVVIWKNDPNAYNALLQSMLQGKELIALLNLLLEPHFLCKYVIHCGIDHVILFVKLLQDRMNQDVEHNTSGALKTVAQLRSTLLKLVPSVRFEECDLMHAMLESQALFSELELKIKECLNEASQVLAVLEETHDERRKLNFMSQEWTTIYDYLAMLEQHGVKSCLSVREQKILTDYAREMDTQFHQDMSEEAENHFLLSSIAEKSTVSIYVTSKPNHCLIPEQSKMIQEIVFEMSTRYECAVEEQRIKLLAHNYAKVSPPSECTWSVKEASIASPRVFVSNLRQPVWEKATFYLMSHDSSLDQILSMIEHEVVPLVQWYLRNRLVELSFVALGQQIENLHKKVIDHRTSARINDNPLHDSFFLIPVRNARTFVERDHKFVYLNCSSKIHAIEEKMALKQMIMPCLLTMVAEFYPKVDFSRSRAIDRMIGNQFRVMKAEERLFVGWKTLRHTLSQVSGFFHRKGPSALIRLSGSQGVGKSMIMAHVADSIAMTSTGTHRVIYYRDSMENVSVPFLQYLCFCFPECKMVQFHSRTFRQWLQTVGISLDIIADGISQDEVSAFEAVFQYSHELHQKIRMLYTLTTGSTRHQCIHVYPLHFDERMSLIDEMCERYALHLDKPCKQNLASKQDSRIPLFLEAAIKTMALFAKTVSEALANEISLADVLWHVIDQCPQDLEDLYEYATIPFLEFKYGRAVVSKVLQTLYSAERPLSFFTVMRIVNDQLSVEPLSHLDMITLYSDLAHFLLNDSDVHDFQIQMKPRSDFRKAVSRRYFRDYILNETESHNLQKTLGRRDSIDKTLFALRSAITCEPRNGPKITFSFDDEDPNNFAGENKDELYQSTPETKLFFRIKPKKKENSEDVAIRKRCLTAHAITIADSHKGGVLCIASWSKNGNTFIATGGNDHNVNVWYLFLKPEFLSQTYQACNDLHNAGLGDIDYFLSKSDSTSASNFFQSPHVLTCLRGHARAVTSLVYGSGLLYSGSSDNIIRIWETQKFECIQTLKMHKGMVTTLLYSNQQLYSAGFDGKVFSFKVGEQFPTASWDRTKRAQILCMQIVGDFLYAGLERRWDEASNPVRIWKMDLTQEVGQLPSREVQELELESSKNKAKVSIIQEKIRNLSNDMFKTHSPIRRGELQQEIQEQQNLKMSLNKKIQHLQTNFHRVNGSLFHTTDVTSIHAPTPRGSGARQHLLITAGSDSILVWDLTSRMCLGSMEGEKGRNVFVKCMCSTSKVLYVGGGSLGEGNVSQRAGRVSVWNCSSRRHLTSLSTDDVVVALHVVEDCLVVGTLAGTVLLYTAEGDSSGFDMQLKKQLRLVQELTIDRSLSYDQKKQELQQANQIMDIFGLIKMFRSDPSVVMASLIKVTSLLDDKTLEVDEVLVQALEQVILVTSEHYEIFKIQVYVLNIISVFDHHILASNESQSPPIKLDKLLPIVKKLHGINHIRTAGSQLPHVPCMTVVAACLIILEKLLTPRGFRELHAHRSHRQDSEHTTTLKKMRSKKQDAADQVRREVMSSLIAEEALNVVLHFVRHYPWDLTCMELAMAILRCSALECPEMTMEAVRESDEDIFDALELLCLDPKFEQHGTSILADLQIVQRHLELRINGKVMPQLASKPAPTSSTLLKYFPPTESIHARNAEATWKHLLHHI
eukprot:751046-Hanusia_phi.AAC.5